MKRFEVQYLEEDKNEIDYGKWVSVPLDMCHCNILCPSCRKLGHASDICDYQFHHTFGEQVAIDKKEALETDGLKARIVVTVLMKCLLKKTKWGKYDFCTDSFGHDRIPANKVMKCLREHDVEHCIDCEDHPQKKEYEEYVKEIKRFSKKKNKNWIPINFKEWLKVKKDCDEVVKELNNNVEGELRK